MYITGKTGNVILLSEEDYRSIQETLYLCSAPGMREKIVEGLNTSLEECVEDTDVDTLWVMKKPQVQLNSVVTVYYYGRSDRI